MALGHFLGNNWFPGDSYGFELKWRKSVQRCSVPGIHLTLDFLAALFSWISFKGFEGQPRSNLRMPKRMACRIVFYHKTATLGSQGRRKLKRNGNIETKRKSKRKRKMEPFNNGGNSWADQWDYNNPDPLPPQSSDKKKGKDGSSKASSAIKKVKERIRDLCQKKSK